MPLKEFAAQFPPLPRLGIRLFGKKFLRSYPYQGTYLMERAQRFRAELTLPLILLGGVTTRATMDRAMAAGFEYVAMARALLREPDLVNRIADDAATPSLRTHCNRCMPTIYTGTRCTEKIP